MSTEFHPTVLIIPAIVCALSAGVTQLAIRYARRRQLLDQPGRRRSHDVPTPRGGGIAIVIAILVGGIVLECLEEPHLDDVLFASLVLVPPIAGIALAGWMDDHGGFSALWRFAIHWIAAFWIVAGVSVLLAVTPNAVHTHWGAVATFMLAVAIVWSINLHNFMDGIDGILTTQAIFVFAELALLSLLSWRVHMDDIGLLLVCAAACIGFLPFNFPHARIFMGDVGSGTLGLVIALAVMGAPRLSIATGIVLCSAFVTDATCTLLSRMLRGRRWYSAHREHLYQWLARSGFSHAQVVALYMGWNLLIVSPVAYWMSRTHVASGGYVWPAVLEMQDGFTGVALVYMVAVALWWYGKRWCLRRARGRSRHVAA